MVIGGGPAGMMAAIAAATRGERVWLLERNSRLGKKLLLTGNGRCNLTNVAPLPEMIANFPGNGSFLYSSLHALDNQALMAFCENLGVRLKVERDGRVFPQSDRAADVAAALARRLKELGVTVIFGARVKAIQTTQSLTAKERPEQRAVQGVIWEEAGQTRQVEVHRALIATGGASYPDTGSTGDGYRLARALGHTVSTLRPSLVPMETREEWPRTLCGLTLRDVLVRLGRDGKISGQEFGELLFTHFGVSGPTVLKLSRLYPQVTLQAEKGAGNGAAHDAGGARRQGAESVWLEIDLKPALSPEQLAAQLRRDFDEHRRKLLGNALGDLLPQRLISVVVSVSGLGSQKPVSQITRAEREQLGRVLKGLRLEITKLRPLAEAIVTAGGVDVREVNPKTMESRLIHGLYFAGEVLDVDGYTGGFNLQAAFSTGWVAGSARPKTRIRTGEEDDTGSRR